STTLTQSIGDAAQGAHFLGEHFGCWVSGTEHPYNRVRVLTRPCSGLPAATAAAPAILTEGGDSTVDVMIFIIVALVAGALGVGLGYSIKRQATNDQRRLAEEGAAETRANADAEKKAILLEAKEEAIRTL